MLAVQPPGAAKTALLTERQQDILRLLQLSGSASDRLRLAAAHKED